MLKKAQGCVPVLKALPSSLSCIWHIACFSAEDTAWIMNWGREKRKGNLLSRNITRVGQLKGPVDLCLVTSCLVFFSFLEINGNGRVKKVGKRRVNVNRALV